MPGTFTLHHRHANTEHIFGVFSTGNGHDFRYPQGFSSSYWPGTRRYQARGMNRTPIVITETLSTPQHREAAPVMVRIMRGIVAALPLTSAESSPWDIWDAVNRARMHAVNVSHQQPVLYVGPSCLRLNGIHGWVTNPRITIYRPSRRCTSHLPSCTVGTTTVPGTVVSCSSIPPITSDRERINGLETEHPFDALIRCALQEDPLEAFTLGCMALHKWSHFSMFDQPVCREQAEQIRSQLLERLTHATTRRGLQRARAILRTIDPGCENPAEAALLWLVRSLCPFPVHTQVRIDVRGRHYFADIVIRDLRIIIEFDGIGKMGETRSGLMQAKRDWIRRDQDLRDAGWNVIRVSWPDYADWDSLRLRLIRTIGHTGASPEFRILWSPPAER